LIDGTTKKRKLHPLILPDYMLLSILHHAWLSFRRAHYFSRGVGIRVLVGFVVLSLLWYMFLIGSALPGILQNLFPDRQPLDVFLSYLLFLYASDLSLRLFSQPIPRQGVTPYLHLPLKRSRLAALTLFRSWFSPYNIYLLALLIPFFMRTLYHPVSPQAFWFMIVGCFLLSGLSHSLGLLMKTYGKKNSRSLAMFTMALVLIIVVGWVFQDQLMLFSGRIGQALLEGTTWVFLLLLLLIAGLQPLIRQGLEAGFYALGSQGDNRVVTSGRFVKLFHKIPIWGPFWELEWKLLLRNKRSRQNLLQAPLMLPVLFYLAVFSPETNLTPMAPFLLLAMGSYGFIHLQYVFSWESRFFDNLATRDFDLKTAIRAKYAFYVLLAALQFLLLTPFVLIWNPAVFPYLAGIFLYATGAGFCILFYSGLANSTRFDPNQRAFFNFEGTSGTLFFVIILIFSSTIPLYIAGSILPFESPLGFSLAAGIAGLAFWAASPAWTADVFRRFQRKKYRNLSKYREK
jgi:hypothetical protein